MFDGVPAHWHKTPEQKTKSDNEAAYVMLGIMLVALGVPAAFLGWALFTSIASLFQ